MPVPPTAATPPKTPAATSTVPAPLAGQVARPLFSLVTAGPGEHTLSISVTPDDLGPVVVRAVISSTGVRMELFAPTDLARDALRLLLPELRRDLAGGALPASLDLSSRNQPGDTGSGRQDRQSADPFGQGSAGFGDSPRGGAGQPRQMAPGDVWLRSAPISVDDGPAGPQPEAGTDGRSSVLDPIGSRRGRVDVLA
jgi:flagellar hook-length control protein FliK